MWPWVRTGDRQPVRKFGSFTADVHRMAQWLKAGPVETVVMQATGVYWVALYQILQEYGFDTQVVNARYTKSLPGRKMEVQECQWLQQLHTFGLLNPSFRPPEQIQAVRSYRRQRENFGGCHFDVCAAYAEGVDGNESPTGQCDQR